MSTEHDGAAVPSAAPTSPGPTSLTLVSSADVTRGLHYFDGRFLRAEDLNRERRAQRAYVDLSNQAGGWGIIHGLDFSVAADGFGVGPGMAVDRAGRLLLVERSHSGLDLAALIEGATPLPPSGDGGGAIGKGTGFEACVQSTAVAETPGTGLYAVLLERVEVAEGTEDVLGRLCDSGCGSASDSRFVVDAVRVRVVPVTGLQLPGLPGELTSVHERSQVASAWFEREQRNAGSLLTGIGLASSAWCAGAVADSSDTGVAIAVLKWDGSAVLWHDNWTVRRERMDPLPASYWAGRAELRPRSVFLAQQLQFQCQLAEISPALSGALLVRGLGATPEAAAATAESSEWVADLKSAVSMLQDADDPAAARRVARGISRLRGLESRLAILSSGPALTGSSRLLLDAGIVTLPPAGYLPVSPGTGQALRQELELLFGPGVDLRLCAVRRDQVPHELERATHMDRISLVRGLADPSDLEQVDVLVPDGVLDDATRSRSSRGFSLDVSVGPAPVEGASSLAAAAAASPSNLAMKGVARYDDGNGVTLRIAIAGTDPASLNPVVRTVADLMRRKVTFPEATGRLGRLRLGTEPVSMSTIREVGLATARATRSLRAEGRTSAAVRVPDSPGQVSAVSASVWTGRDPFTLTSGEFTAFHAELDQAMPQSPTFGVSAVADGRATWVSGGDAVGTTTITLDVVGVAFVSGSGVARDSSVQQIRSTLVLSRRTDGSGAVTVEVLSPKARFRATVRLVGPPYVAEGEIGTTQGQVAADQTAALFRAEETRGPLPAGEEHREAAIHAIQVLSALRPADSLYVERGFADLFPDLGAVALSVLRPVHPWVLFRRRRRHECEGEGGVPTQGTSRVGVAVATADDVEEAERWAEALVSGASEERVSWTAMDPLLFESGTASLRSSSAQWRAAYHASGAGNVIRFAGYARASSTADPPIGLSRARSLVEVTEPVATMDPQGEVDEVLAPPDGHVAPDTEGTIFLVSYPIPEGVTVTAVDGTSEEGTAVVDAVRQADVQALTDALAALAEAGTEPVLHPIASLPRLASLTAGERTSALDLLQQLIEAVSSAGAPQPSIVAVVWSSNAAPAQVQARSRTVGERIAEQLGTDDVTTATVAFEPEDDEMLRVYLLLRPEGE